MPTLKKVFDLDFGLYKVNYFTMTILDVYKIQKVKMSKNSEENSSNESIIFWQKDISKILIL